LCCERPLIAGKISDNENRLSEAFFDVNTDSSYIHVTSGEKSSQNFRFGGSQYLLQAGYGRRVRCCLENGANRRGKRCRREKRACSISDYRFMWS
jgi:hypothetical protein